MNRIRTIVVGATAAAVIAGLAACAPVSTAESLTVTVNPGKCIAVQYLGHNHITRICNYTSKLPRSYWFPNGTNVWHV